MDYDELRKILVMALKKMLKAYKSKGRSLIAINYDYRSLIEYMERIAIDLDLIKEGDNESGNEYDNLIFNKENRQKAGKLIWDFILNGIINPKFSVETSMFKFDDYRFEITVDGIEFLETERYFPYDPEGYLKEIKEENPDLDPIVLQYLKESLRSLYMRCYFSSTVMLGVASEKLILLLFEVFGNAIEDDTERELFVKKIEKEFTIKRKYVVFFKEFEKRKDKIPKKERNEFNEIIDSVFTMIRYYRNDAGHPSGKEISKNTAYINMSIFPHYTKIIYSLMEFLEKNTI